MKAWFLIPKITESDEHGEMDTHPKYVMNMLINWSSAQSVLGDFFLVKVATQNLTSIQELSLKSDVIKLDDAINTKRKVSGFFGLGTRDLDSVADIREYILKSINPDYRIQDIEISE